jgi:hypothetical protein
LALPPTWETAMTFTHPAPDVVESDLGYRVERGVYPYARYVEGVRSARIEWEIHVSGNQFLGIPGDGISRCALFPRTIRMEGSGAPFSAEEQIRLVRRIMAAWEWEGTRVKVMGTDKQQDASVYYASET